MGQFLRLSLGLERQKHPRELAGLIGLVMRGDDPRKFRQCGQSGVGYQIFSARLMPGLKKQGKVNAHVPALPAGLWNIV